MLELLMTGILTISCHVDDKIIKAQANLDNFHDPQLLKVYHLQDGEEYLDETFVSQQSSVSISNEDVTMKSTYADEGKFEIEMIDGESSGVARLPGTKELVLLKDCRKE